MLRSHYAEHTLLEFVGKPEHNHKSNKSKQCVPSGKYGQNRLSQCGEVQEGLGESEEKEVLVVKMASLKAGIFNSLSKNQNKQTKLYVTFLATILVNKIRNLHFMKKSFEVKIKVVFFKNVYFSISNISLWNI